ncbi:unnamed protein product [Cylicostephanus goldi]|uniref:ABC transmembrane type-1 domain-containing protein n=1 Tax=Cylicostephanus goldi TaxID=71465 RepID=A0A3P6UJH0_CYLGO|nr:unnamed protein product [Cylicostephanus goldi]
MIILTKFYGDFYDVSSSLFASFFSPSESAPLFQRLSESTQNTVAKANQIAAEVLSTMRTVRSFACEKREVNRFSNTLSNVLKFDKKRSLASAGYTWSCDIAESITIAIILFYGGHLVFSGSGCFHEIFEKGVNNLTRLLTQTLATDIEYYLIVRNLREILRLLFDEIKCNGL